MVSLKKNFIYSIMYQILVMILPLITTPYISRVLGAEGIGEYSYTQSVASYFILAAMLGISQYGNRAISSCRENKEKRSKVFWNIYTIQFFTHLIAIVIYIIYARVFNNDRITWIQLIYVISGIFDISWFYFGIEHFDITVSRNTFIKISTVVLIFLLVDTKEDLWIYTLILVSGTLLSQLYLWCYLTKYIIPKKITWRDVKGGLKPILILFIPVLSYSIYKVMDKVMLGILTSYQQVGLYENAYKINNIPIGFITAIGNVMLPRSSAMIAAGKKGDVKKNIKTSFIIFDFFAIALIFGIDGISTNFAVIYFGEEFIKSGILIKYLNWSVFFVIWANILRTQYLIPNKKDETYVISTLSGAIINLTLNILLIPRYQAMGAVLGTCAAEFTVMVVQAASLRKEIPVFRYILGSWPYFIIGIVMMLIVEVIGEIGRINVWTLMLQIIIGALLFIGISFGVSYSRKDDIWEYVYKYLCKKFVDLFGKKGGL